MHMDKRVELADGVSAIQAVGNAVKGDVVNLFADNVFNNVLLDIGVSQPLYLVIQVDTAIVGSGAVVTFTLQSDSTSDLATSATSHTSVTFTVPANPGTPAGTQFILSLPPAFTVEKFLGLRMTVATANVTAGTFSAFFTHQPRLWTPFSDQILN